MTFIKILPHHLIDQIAAGEVVERPSSVVKELVENSLDAHPTHIGIDLAEGGRKSILVRDDGCGIPPDELKLAVSRHATSKMAHLDDLQNLQTMGFRGEALASIAAVSKMVITSKLKEADLPARQLLIEGGTFLDEHEAGHPVGTTIQVKYLFYNVPARLKFLKTPETELGHIMDYVIKAALVNPDVGFKLTHQEKLLIHTRPHESLKQRVAQLFDEATANQCTFFSKDQGDLSVSGLLGHPSLSRSHARDLYLFVNQRPVKDKMMQHAVLEAYRNLMMRGRYPFLVLFLNLPGALVDVNVHPQKSEVRFTQSQMIHRLVEDALKETLYQEPWLKKAPEVSPPFLDFDKERSWPHKQESLKLAPSIHDDNGLVSLLKKEWGGRVSAPQLEARDSSSSSSSSSSLDSSSASVYPHSIPYAQLQILGQFLATYLVCSYEDRLVLIDQHAACERIGFEQLLLKYQEGVIPSEALLIPETFDLSLSETEMAKKIIVELENFGIELEHFGGTTFVLRAVPFYLKGRVQIKHLISDLVGDFLEKGSLTSLKDHFHHVLATMACHAAIRANHVLTLDEMKALLKDLGTYQFTSFCPHGRPAAVEMTKTEIEKWFKRIV